ncbi:MAG: winged helix-turn-helix transcriptional regulator [Pirellulales bacterium]
MVCEHSDQQLLDHLRRHGSASIVDLRRTLDVTATAVRQRLNRLMGQGIIQRETQRQGRGRPGHRYSLTEKGVRLGGDNYADLAGTLWDEIREIKDQEIRQGLLRRIATKLAARYRGEVNGSSTEQRMAGVVKMMADRGVPFEVDRSGELPILTALACPYPELAEQDRGVCAMERMLFSELLGEAVKLSSCRLDGASCCDFEPVA